MHVTVPRNFSRDLHPFEAPREYTRALNATKLERVFAKPLLGALEGHKDGVHCMCKHPTRLSVLLSGSYDGEVSICCWFIDWKLYVFDWFEAAAAVGSKMCNRIFVPDLAPSILQRS